MRRAVAIALPVVIVVAGAAVAAGLVVAGPEVEKEEKGQAPPAVETVEASAEDLTLLVRTHGTVEPRLQTTLIAEVAGRIVWVSPRYERGAFVEEGELVLRVDPSDYRAAVARAEADLARAKVALEQERARSRIAREEWAELSDAPPNPLRAREPQLARARQGVASAEANLAKARIDLRRTRVVAPFAGRLNEKYAQLAQYVAPGTRLVDVYATDYAEVRVPIRKEALGHLGVSPAMGDFDPPLEAELRGSLGGSEHAWSGRVERTSGVIEPRTRTVDLFVRVQDPFNRDGDAHDEPLPMGLFVDVELEGRRIDNAIRVPREALRRGDRVYFVDERDQLIIAEVDVLQKTDEHVVIAAPPDADGHRAVVSKLEQAVAGMPVRRVEEETRPKTARREGDTP